MQVFFYLAILFAIMVATFAIQNSQMISIRFIAWQLPAIPLAIIILGAALSGAVAAFLFSIAGYFRHLRQRNELRERLHLLEKELSQYSAPKANHHQTDSENHSADCPEPSQRPGT